MREQQEQLTQGYLTVRTLSNQANLGKSLVKSAHRVGMRRIGRHRGQAWQARLASRAPQQRPIHYCGAVGQSSFLSISGRPSPA